MFHPIYKFSPKFIEYRTPFQIPWKVLECFLLKLEEGYSKHKNPYHNLKHGADVRKLTSGLPFSSIPFQFNFFRWPKLSIGLFLKQDSRYDFVEYPWYLFRVVSIWRAHLSVYVDMPMYNTTSCIAPSPICCIASLIV